MFQITPLDLSSNLDYADDLSTNSRFNWRWFKRNESDFRVVTIEDEPSDFSCNHKGYHCIRTRDFQGDNENISATQFNWRWFERDGVSFRVLTIEDGGEEHSGSNSIVPKDLAGKENSGYENGIDNMKFNWRWFDRNGTEFRFVTIEE